VRIATSVALRTRVAARSPTSEASCLATKANECEREPSRVVRHGLCAGLEFGRITPSHPGVHIATFVCAVPARCGALATGFVETAINEIIAKRMSKSQQMRRNRWTVQPFLAVRSSVLNETLQDSFRAWFPGFRRADVKTTERLAA
jgi:hypothetical protein